MDKTKTGANMRARLILGWLVVLMMVAAIGYAQEAPVRRLSLAEAMETARENNPTYLTAVANRAPAASQSLNSAVTLFTPSVSLSGGGQWYQKGNANLSGITFDTPRSTSSAWQLNFGYQLSGATIANRGLAAALLRAADQDIASQRTVLEAAVEQEYVNLLEARAQAELAQHVVDRAQEVLNLAQAQYSVGQKTMIDVRTAQVAKGTADVSLLQAQQNVEIEVLKLFQLMGVPAPEGIAVVPSDTFPVTEPQWKPDSLVALALSENPVLRAIRARATGARWSTRAAYSTYLPTLQLSASYGKYSQTSWNQATDPLTKLPVGPDTIVLRQNGTNPPWNLRLGLSIPLFDAFARNVQISQARANERGYDLSIRAQELAVRANVHGAYTTLISAYRTIGVQANNRTAADEALSLATERYRVGSGSIIELLDARVASETAGNDYVKAVYNYHKAIAALEQAVGQPLR
jgi:outer membrane protein